MLGKIEDRRRGWQRMRWSGSTSNSMDLRLDKPRVIVKEREARHAAVCAVEKSRT